MNNGMTESCITKYLIEVLYPPVENDNHDKQQ